VAWFLHSLLYGEARWRDGNIPSNKNVI